MSKVLRLLVPALAVMACAPDKEPPFQVMAVVQTNAGAYEPREVSLTTVTDVISLEGTTAKFRGGARIVVDPRDPQLATNNGQLTDEQLAQVYIKAAGEAPQASYVEKEGVLWPADFHTWNLVTTAYLYENAFRHFQARDVLEAELLEPDGNGPIIYYYPDFTMTDLSAQPLMDNALFFSPIQAFAILPPKDLQTIPLSMNYGVVVHEYAHRVFNRRAYGKMAIPLPFQFWAPEVGAHPQLNLLKSIDEGLSDFHAYGATCATPFGCNAKFMSASLGETAADDRDLTQTRCVDENLRNAMASHQISEYSALGLPYKVGTIFAHALHKAGGPDQREELERAVLESYDDPDPANPGIRQLIEASLDLPGSFNLANVAAIILRHIPTGSPDLKIETCNRFLTHLQIIKEDLGDACPLASFRSNECPAINP
jgi:hypothetical protein